MALTNEQLEAIRSDASYLIKYYNFRTGSRLKSSTLEYLNAVGECLLAHDNNVDAIKEHIKDWTYAHKSEYNLSSRFMECIADFGNPTPSTPREIKVEAPAIVVEQPKSNAPSLEDSLKVISDTVAAVVANAEADKIKKEIMSSVQSEVRNFISAEYGPIERKITTIVDGKKHELKGLLHEKFETVLKFVANDEPVFLTGPAGSGKNYICKQVAESLGLKFYFSNAVTQEYKLTGFTDAMGNYQPTQFYKAFTEGGLFMLDEMDASIPEVLVILNAAIANRYFDFPAPIGYKEAHPDFRVVAAGNTTGHGADYEYVGRNQLDGASLDRFAIVAVDYSKDIENGLVSDKAIADFCRDFRKAASKVGVNVIVSYRAISRLGKMSQVLSLEEALKTCLVKDLEKDDLNVIRNELRDSQYKRALGNIWSSM